MYSMRYLYNINNIYKPIYIMYILRVSGCEFYPEYIGIYNTNIETM